MQKALWVDECYTFYGIDHDSFSSFWDSMLSGINFSPPLYFFINWFAAFCLPISIELLRLESILWTVLGLIFFYHGYKKILGTSATAISIILVISQSNLLLDNSTEARHYTMFFACASWVFLTIPNLKHGSKNLHPIEHFSFFISHFCLCLSHYLGIVFSLLFVVGILLSRKDINFAKRIPWSILTCWLIVIPVYLFFLQNQSSHLNTWPKSKSIDAIFENYDYSALFLSLIIPLITCFLMFQKKKYPVTSSSSEVRMALFVSVLWFLAPFLFWILANLVPLNLLKERYFIPKEIGLLAILAFAVNRCCAFIGIRKRDLENKSGIPIIVITFYSLFMIFVYHKRSSFGYSENRNYYHWLHIDDSVEKLNLPIIISGDPLFFPNTYQNEEQYFFHMDDKNLQEIYSRFSSKLNIVSSSELLSWDSFILVGKSDSFKSLDASLFSSVLLGKVHERLPFLIKRFKRI